VSHKQTLKDVHPQATVLLLDPCKLTAILTQILFPRTVVLMMMRKELECNGEWRSWWIHLKSQLKRTSWQKSKNFTWIRWTKDSK